MVYARLGSLVKIGLRSPRAVSLASPISAEPPLATSVPGGNGGFPNRNPIGYDESAPMRWGRPCLGGPVSPPSGAAEAGAAGGAVCVGTISEPPGAAGVDRSNAPPLVTSQTATTKTAIPTTPAAIRWLRRVRSRRRMTSSRVKVAGPIRPRSCSRMDWKSVIGRIYLAFQRSTSLVLERPDCRGLHAERLRGLVRAVAE
jgi:hypothetical protein